MESARPRILVVDDEEAILETMSFTFEDDFEVHTFTDPRAALEQLDRDGPFAVVLSDQRMPEMSGVEFVSEVRRRHPATVRIILTGFSDMDAIIQAINDGHVYAYITKPWEPDELKQVMKRAVDHYRLAAQNERLLVDLRRESRFLAAVIDELDSGAIAVDPEGVVRAVNRPVREYLALDADPTGRLLRDLLEEKELLPVGDAAAEASRDKEVSYLDADVKDHRFRITIRKLSAEGEPMGVVILFREISHEPLRQRFEELIGEVERSEDDLRARLEAGREQLAELSEAVQRSSLQTPGMTELGERVSRARTAVENWLAVDAALAGEDFPDAQLLQDRMRLAHTRWPRRAALPDRVQELARRVTDYYESGEQIRESVL